jgi:ATP-dependent helicase/nuclease subunit B
MAVRFILGRSGTGKTGHCIKAVVNALSATEESEQPLILLVPEQATYQAERAILGDERIAGYSRLHVLSFDRLQFLLLGKNAARPRLSRIARQMIIHRILRDNKDKLHIFGSSADRPGLARQMTDTITELHEYAKTPDDIDQLLGELQKGKISGLTEMKFADIGLILREYLKFIEGRFLDPDVQLAHACRAVADADFVRGAKLWVDGFAGFTMSELAILAELLKAADDSQIALCLDPSEIDPANPNVEAIDPAGLFYPTQRTYAELIEIIRQSKLPLAEPVILKPAVRFSVCRQLAHIEGCASEDEPSRIAAGDSIRIISAPNERAEVRFVARRILDLVRRKDYRYRDIAVIASDIERYQHYIEAYFNDYAVPFFIDKRRPLNQHPVVGLICSAMQAVAGDFSNSDVFAYLKTDLVPIERGDVDALENYCLAFGVSGADWQSDKQWQFAGPDNGDFDEERINQIRENVVRPLIELRNRLCPADNQEKKIDAGEFSQAVFDFIETLKVADTVGGWIEQAERRRNNAAVEEHRQFYSKLVDVFDELSEVFAGASMTAEDYAAIISSAFSQLTLAFIPPRLDQVLVGSIERSRHPDLKAVFLIGATQKQFPVPVGSTGILTDEDRNVAESADFPLAPGTDRTLAERRYLAYIAFTRPSELLYMTYPAIDEKGSGVPRSQFVDQLESMFEDLAEESIAGEQDNIESVHNSTELADLLCSRLGRDAPTPQATDNAQLDKLLDDIHTDAQLADVGSAVLSALNYDNRAELNGEVVAEFFGRKLNSSATALSTFAKCPYQHFARYVLELKERQEFKFEPLDLGSFYHRALDAWLKRVKAGGLDFGTVSDEQLVEILREEISRLVAEDAFLSNFVRHGPHNTFIIDNAGEVLADCAPAVAQMIRAGCFEPTLSEVSFGRARDAGDTLGDYELALPDGRVLSLSGKIDRLDVAKSDGGQIAIVFDYKRSKDKAKFEWKDFYHGLDMQLPIYMLAVRNTSGGRDIARQVVGAFYMPVEVAPQSATLDDLAEAKDVFNYKAKGIFNGEFYRQLDNAAGGWSKFYSFFVNAKGDQYGNYATSAALRASDFEVVLRFAEQKMIELAGEILAGKIGIRPYRIAADSPCGNCKYKSVCRFDWQINDFNPLPSLAKTEVIEKIGGADG